MNEPESVPEEPPKPKLVEGVDFYFEDGLMVLTREFLLKRGHCCGSGCRNCPYDHEADKASE